MSRPATEAGRLGAAAALVACVILFLGPALVGGGQFYFRDVSQNHYPMRQFVAEELSAGRVPLWNPYLTFGQPAAANPNYGVLHPTTLLLLILPFDAAFRWGIAFSFLLAAAGTYWLARDLGASRTAAWLAGIGFTLSGAFASLGNLYNLLSTAAWMSLAVLLLRRAVARGGPAWTFAAAAVLALQIAAGEPLMVAATLGLAVLLLPREGSGRRRALRLGSSVGLAILLGAMAALPLLEALRWSERGAGLDWDALSKWSTRPLRLFELVVPGLFGDPTALTPDRYWGEGFFESTLPLLLGIYVGGPLLLLAGVALGGWRVDRVARRLALGGGLSIWLALGSHGGLLLLLHRLGPGLHLVRYPSKLLVPAALTLALLAARGCDRLSSWRGTRVPRSLWATAAALALVPAGGLLLAGSLPGVAGDVLHGAMAAGGAPGGARDAAVLPQISASCLRAIVLLAAATLLAWLTARGEAGRYSPALLLAALVAADLFAANASLNPTVDPEWYRVEPRIVGTIRRVDPAGRVFRFPRPSGFGLRAARDADASSAGFLWDRMSLRNATSLPYRVPLAWDRNTERLHPGAAASLSRRLESEASLGERLRAWRLGGVRFVLAYDEIPIPDLRLLDAVRGESTHPLLLYELQATLPRARVVGRVERTPRPIERAMEPGFDPSGTLTLPGAEQPPDGVAGASSARVLWEDAGRIELRTEAAFDGWLVLADSHYPGWVAELDGDGVPIEAAYGVFRAVRVPAGEHRVTFRYAPSSWRAGLGFAGAGLLAALLAALWRRRAAA